MVSIAGVGSGLGLTGKLSRAWLLNGCQCMGGGWDGGMMVLFGCIGCGRDLVWCS